MATAQVEIRIPQMDLHRAVIVLDGMSPLICHAWSQKARQQMLDAQMKKATKAGRAAKDPQQDFEDSLYPMPEGSAHPYGFPAVAFKAAAVDACSQVAGVTKVEARGAFHVEGELLGIDGTPTPREDMVRIGMGTADIRFRGEFRTWSVEVPIVFNPRVLSLEQLANLFDVAGFAVGVGERRPQKDGSYGMFRVRRGA